ncbi:ABC transporter permease [Derxia gummosa]|uniref:ABC transporter permease n=1 Tax=Derxia gummosa DSM 723 TaxID=1121388 RepID=A0A8B6X2G2_9BURK|nr:ABC transporter permease [Derxia gummosa]
MNPITTGTGALAFAAGMLLADALLSAALDLGIGRALLVGGLRCGVQLLLVGLVLTMVFGSSSPWLAGGVLLVMCLAAAREIDARQRRRFAGPGGRAIGGAMAVLATLITVVPALATLDATPWYSPQMLIPLAGIALGTVMNGVGLALDSFTTLVTRERAAIEARLALGAGRFAALRDARREVMRTGVIHIVNQMSAAGIITLPGMMTGQILAGQPPVEAAKAQIFVLLLLAAATGLGVLGVVTLAVHRVTDARDRLRLDRLVKVK